MTGAGKRSLLTRSSLAGGSIAGLVHAGVAVALWNHWFDSLGAMLVTKPLDGTYVLLGTFLLGFVPAVFYVGDRVVSPAIVVAACLLASGLASVVAGPVSAPSAAPTPFALYVLLWVGVVAIAAATGLLEQRRRRRATG